MRVLSARRVVELRALQSDAVDAISGARSRRALGYGLGGDPAQGGSIEQGGPESFGHGGYGGSSGFADPLRKIGFGLTKNLMTAGEPTQAVAYRVAELVRRQVDGNWDAFQSLVSQIPKETDVNSKSASAELDDMRR